MVMKKGNDQKQNAEKRKNRMTALLMALILCVGMVSGTNKEVRAQSASQNSETQTASESDVTTENTANIAGNTTKSAATVTHYEYTTEEVKETLIIGIWTKNIRGDKDDMQTEARNTPTDNLKAASSCAKQYFSNISYLLIKLNRN